MAVLVSVAVCVLMVSWCLKVLHLIWWKPKMVEKQLREQGIYGLPYRLWHGNTKEMMKLSKETGSKPLGLSHDILPRLDPFLHKMALTYSLYIVAEIGRKPVENIRDPVVEKLSKYVVAPIISYLLALFRYNGNIEDLKTQLGKLRDIRDEVQGLVVAAERNGEVALPRVQRWLESAKETLEDRMNLLDKKLYLNLKVRYQRSRIATEKTSAVDELIQKSRSIDRVSIFRSRMLIFRDIMEALKGNQINSIGICGPAGVGKTYLLKDVVEEVKDRNLFEEIAMVTVSSDPKRIQCEIADALGWRFDESVGRARWLFQRLEGKKRLIILDDIREKVDLETIGIPKERYEGCKTLLVSRSQGVCDQSGAEMDFSIEALSEDEGCKLFRRMVGNSVDSPDLHPLAVEVAKGCGGLPKALVIAARALKKCSCWSEVKVAKLSKEVEFVDLIMPSVDNFPTIHDRELKDRVGGSIYKDPIAGLSTVSILCVRCEQIWASNRSMDNYQKSLRGEHINDESSLPVPHPRNPSVQQHPSNTIVLSGGSLRRSEDINFKAIGTKAAEISRIIFS